MRSSHIFILLLIAFLVACVAPGPADHELKIRAQQNRWNEKNIRSYRISVMKVQAIWHVQTNTLTVREGKVIDQSATCTPALSEHGECQVENFNPDDFTVDGLFQTALSLAPYSEKYQLHVTFDGVYAFPRYITLDNQEMVDEETSWRVTAFEVLR